MKALLSKFLQVRSHETSAFCCCFLILFFIGVAATIGMTVTDALFLKEIGAAYLPQMMVVSSVVIIAAFPGYDKLARRLSSNAIFYLLTAFFGVVVSVHGFVLLLLPAPPKAVYVVLLPLFALFYAFFNAHFANYVVHFFDPMQSKRLLPAIFSATTIGIIVGGGLVPLLLHFGGSHLLLFVWAGILLCVALLVRINRANRTVVRAAPQDDPHGGLLEELRAVMAMVRKSRFILFSLLFAFLTQVLVTANEVVSSTVFAAMPAFADSESLMAFYGKLEMSMGCIALVVQLAVIPTLIRRFGIGPVAVITPLLQILAFSGLAFGGAGAVFAFAILARVNMTASCDYIDPIAQNLLLNALGPQQKSQVISLSHGIVGQSGPILAGLLLSGFAMFGGVLHWTWVFIVLAGVALLVARQQIRQYARELMRLLENHHFDLFKATTEGTNNLGPEVFAFMEQKLASPDSAAAAMAAQFLADIRKGEALPVLCRSFLRADPPLRASLLQLFAAIGELQPEVRSAIRTSLSDCDQVVQREALIAYSVLWRDDCDQEHLLPLLASPCSATASLAAVVLFNRSGDESILSLAKDFLRRLLAGDRSNAGSSAIDALAHLVQPDPELIADMIKLFEAPMPLPRSSALALQELACKLRPLSLPRETQLLLRAHGNHPVREVRLAAYQLLAAAGALDEALLMEGLGDEAEKVRSWVRVHVRKESSFDHAALRSLAADMGRPFLWESANLLQAELLEGKDDLALLALIDGALAKSGETLAWLVHCDRHYAGDRHVLLRTVLDDRLKLTVGTAICMLEHLGDAEIGALARKSFQNGDQRLRACALEALEQVKVEGIKQTIRLLEPFLLVLPNEQQLRLFEEVQQPAPSSPERLFDLLLEGPGDWERAIARYSLDEPRA